MDVLRVSNMKYLWHMIFAFYNGLHEFMGWSEERFWHRCHHGWADGGNRQAGRETAATGRSTRVCRGRCLQPKVHEFLEKAAL